MGTQKFKPRSFETNKEIEERVHAPGAGVRFVEPNYIVTSLVVPNDNLYKSQYAYNNIQAPQAWNLSTGASMTNPRNLMPYYQLVA